MKTKWKQTVNSNGKTHPPLHTVGNGYIRSKKTAPLRLVGNGYIRSKKTNAPADYSKSIYSFT